MVTREKNKKYVKTTFPNEINKILMIETGIHSSISQRIYKIKDYIDTDSFLLTNGDALFQMDYQKKKNIFINLNSMHYCLPIVC